MIFSRRKLEVFGDVKNRRLRSEAEQNPFQIFINLRFDFEIVAARVMRRKIKRAGVCGKNAARIFRFRFGRTRKRKQPDSLAAGKKQTRQNAEQNRPTDESQAAFKQISFFQKTFHLLSIVTNLNKIAKFMIFSNFYALKKSIFIEIFFRRSFLRDCHFSFRQNELLWHN